jgi:hypothetical protein
MSKFDFVDAYKNIPATLSDLRLQGFAWLGKYFVENNMTFGGKPLVQNFDIVGATIKELALTKCKIPAKLVHRQLDDVPVVSRLVSRFFRNIYRTMQRNKHGVSPGLQKQ